MRCLFVCLFFSLVEFRRRSFLSSKVNRTGEVSIRARFVTFIKVYLRFRKKIQEVLTSPNPEFSCTILVSVLFCNRSEPEFSDYGKDLGNSHFRTILFHQSSPTTYLYILWVSILYKIQYDHLIPIEEINMTSNFDVTHISSKSMVLGDPGGVNFIFKRI